MAMSWNAAGASALRGEDNIRAVKRVLILLIVGMLFLGVGQETQVLAGMEFPFTGVINANSVNIRAGASPGFEILGQLNKTDKVIVKGVIYRWYKIRLPQHAKSFISKEYIYQRGEEGIVSEDNVNIRAGKGTNHNILGQLSSGDSVTILKEHDSWFQIEPPQDAIGWVRSDFVEYYAQELFQEEMLPPGLASTEEVEEVKQAEQITTSLPIASGIVDDLGVIINRPGRQKLTDDDGQIFYLKSEKIDLAQYVYYHVRVWGSIEKLPGLGHPLITVEKIELSEGLIR